MLEKYFYKIITSAGLGEALNEATSISESDSPEKLVDKIVKVAVPLSISCALALFAYAAYLMISSQGNPDKIGEARSVITNAVIGMVVVLACTAILLVIDNLFGLDAYD